MRGAGKTSASTSIVQLDQEAPVEAPFGNVRVSWKGPDPDQETLELIERIELTPEALAEARAAAMKLEARGYELNPTAYGKTPPIEVEE